MANFFGSFAEAFGPAARASIAADNARKTLALQREREVRLQKNSEQQAQLAKEQLKLAQQKMTNEEFKILSTAITNKNFALAEVFANRMDERQQGLRMRQEGVSGISPLGVPLSPEVRKRMQPSPGAKDILKIAKSKNTQSVQALEQAFSLAAGGNQEVQAAIGGMVQSGMNAETIKNVLDAVRKANEETSQVVGGTEVRRRGGREIGRGPVVPTPLGTTGRARDLAILKTGATSGPEFDKELERQLELERTGSAQTAEGVGELSAAAKRERNKIAGRREGARDAAVPGNLRALLGVPQGEVNTMREVEERFGIDPETPPKVIEDAGRIKSNAASSLRTANRLRELIATTDATTIGDRLKRFGVNVITNIRSLSGFLAQPTDVYTDSTTGQQLDRRELLNPNRYRDTLSSPGIQGLLQEWTKAGINSALAESMMLNLAFSIARTNNDGGRLSDQDVRFGMRELGTDASPEIRGAALDSVARRVEEQALQQIGGTLGLVVSKPGSSQGTIFAPPLLGKDMAKGRQIIDKLVADGPDAPIPEDIADFLRNQPIFVRRWVIEMTFRRRQGQ